jgi:hypothetical protein
MDAFAPRLYAAGAAAIYGFKPKLTNELGPIN